MISVLVVCAFHPSTREAEAGRSEFEACLVYRVSSRQLYIEKHCLGLSGKKNSKMIVTWETSEIGILLQKDWKLNNRCTDIQSNSYT